MPRTKLSLYARAAKLGWVYSGDRNLRYGGLFWRDVGATDYVEAVDVAPASDSLGPDNVFEIRAGSIYLDSDNDKRWSALDCIGADRAAIGPYTLGELVYAMNAYHGLDADAYGRRVVRIGAIDKLWDDRGGAYNPEPDRILPGNAKLSNYVFTEFVT